MLQADNHEYAWVFVQEAVVGSILDKGGAEENDVVILTNDAVGLEDIVSSLNLLAHDEGIEGQLFWVHL